jgi:hypothetical protein
MGRLLGNLARLLEPLILGHLLLVRAVRALVTLGTTTVAHHWLIPIALLLGKTLLALAALILLGIITRLLMAVLVETWVKPMGIAPTCQWHPSTR